MTRRGVDGLQVVDWEESWQGSLGCQRLKVDRGALTSRKEAADMLIRLPEVAVVTIFTVQLVVSWTLKEREREREAMTRSAVLKISVLKI